MNKQTKDMSRSEVHEVLGGEATIFKIKGMSGDVFQFRQWIKGEKQAFRRSLKTRDLNTALQRAKSLVVENLANSEKGVKIFGITLREAIDRYLEAREQDVDVDLITKGRLQTISSNLKNLKKIFGRDDLKISELDRNSLNINERSYYRDRLKMSPTVNPITIANEQSTINAMMTWCYKNGFSHFEKFDFAKMKVDRNAPMRRDNFTLEEYRRLTRYLVEYTKEANCSDKIELYERQLSRELILVLANTMMRVGELIQLKWGDIKEIKKTFDTNGTEMHLATIMIRGQTSKVRKDRRIIVRGGDYLLRLKQIQKYTDDEDYVFTDNKTRRRVDRKKWYVHWASIMKGLDIDYKKRNLTMYSLRHFSITQRLRANVSIYKLSEIAGTGVANISKFYGHITDEMMTSAARQSLKNDEFAYMAEEKLIK